MRTMTAVNAARSRYTRKPDFGGAAAEVAAVVGIALVLVAAAALLVAKGVQWLTDYLHKPKPMIIAFDGDGGGDGGGGAPSEMDEEEERRVEADTGSFTDSRDGRRYRTVNIGGRAWMAENLNYKTSTGSWCYMNDTSYCDKYGRLYDWNTAKTACPDGWHLPASREWDSLGRAAGGERWRDADSVFYWFDAGTRLKAKRGWNEDLKGEFLIKSDGSLEELPGRSGNGTDAYGFAALPGNFRFPTGDFCNDFAGHWWTATEIGGKFADRAYILHDNGDMFMYRHAKQYGFSVRCAAD